MKLNLKRALSWQNTRLARLVPLLGGWSPMPLAVSFTVTGACNLRCEMCSTRAAHPRHMDLDLYRSVLRDVRRGFLLRPLVHLIGGEPLLHPKLDAMIAEARRLGFPVAVTTNGFLLRDRAPALLSLRQVTVSVDGTADVHDRIRGVSGSYERAIRGIREVARLRRGGRPLVAVNCTITPWNADKLCATARALSGEPVESLTFQHMSFDWDEPALSKGIDTGRLAKELRSLSQLPLPYPVNVFPPIREGELGPYYRSPGFRFGRGCLVPWVALRIYEDGTVAPCQDFIVGKAGEQSIRRLWNGPGMSGIRRRIARGALFRKCQRCCHRRYYPLAPGKA